LHLPAPGTAGTYRWIPWTVRAARRRGRPCPRAAPRARGPAAPRGPPRGLARV